MSFAGGRQQGSKERRHRTDTVWDQPGRFRPGGRGKESSSVITTREPR
jgi:hypothetical protein